MTGHPTPPGAFTHHIERGPKTVLTSTYTHGDTQVTSRVTWTHPEATDANIERAQRGFENRVSAQAADTLTHGENRLVRRKPTRYGTLYLGLRTGADREWLPTLKPRLRDTTGRLHPGLLVGWLSTAAHLSFKPGHTP